MKKLERKLNSLPKNPGVYLFKDSKGSVLYVGKAKNLRSRVKSYFRKSTQHLPKTEIMITLIADLDYMIVSNETESLILENNLIKQYRPPFNVRMRDDKNYQFIKIDYSSEIPQVYTVRKIEDRKKAKYFGPYTSGLSVKRTMKLLKKIFHLCQNKKISKKPCFAYHLKRCSGVCAKKVTTADYKKTLKQVEAFLKNEQKQIIRELDKQMQRASKKNQFEKAAIIRDRIASLRNIWERQKIVSTKNENADYVGLYTEPEEAFVSLFLVRQGKLINQKEFELLHKNAEDKEILLRFISQYYMDASNKPNEIYTPIKLKKVKGLNVKIAQPIRGRKKQLLELASKNARLLYKKSLASFEKEKEIGLALEELKNLFKLKKIPDRIEGFDISNIQGTNPVGSMVVFTKGIPDNSAYRKFKIRSKTTPDDVGMIKEMIMRRFRHIEKGWKKPDLVVIDGGKGQLNAALEMTRAAKLKIKTIGLAKRLEEIYLPNKKEPLRLSKNSPALKMLQRVRDEAHRFAITFHKKRRHRSQIRSRLDDVAGIGPITKKQLLKKFGTVSEIKKAPLEAIAKTVGADKAKKIKEQL